jgi:hypothetical protein
MTLRPLFTLSPPFLELGNPLSWLALVEVGPWPSLKVLSSN